MPLVIADLVLETSVTTGTGTLTLGGAPNGYRTFSSAIGNGNTTFYRIRNKAVDTEWEVGIGTVSAGALARTSVIASSNANAAVNFSGGDLEVFVTVPADRVVIVDGSVVQIPGSAKVPVANQASGKHSIFVPAAGMISRITGGAAYSQGETSSNRVQMPGFLFDGTTAEHVQFMLGAPKGWNKGTVVARFVYAPTTTSSTAAWWGIAGRAFGDGDDLDAAFGSEQGNATSHTTANRVEISASTSAITIAGTPVTDDLLIFQVRRNPADAGDTYGADALLLGVWLDFTYDSNTDD